MGPNCRRTTEGLRISRQQPGHQNPHVTEPRIAQCQGVLIADTDTEAEAIGRAVWADYQESLMRAHGRIPPHRQEAVPDVLDNPVAKAQLMLDPIQAADRDHDRGDRSLRQPPERHQSLDLGPRLVEPQMFERGEDLLGEDVCVVWVGAEGGGYVLPE